MKPIGFNFTKILAQKTAAANKGHTKTTNIEFTDITPEEIPLLKDEEAIRISFSFSIDYEDSQSSDNKESTKQKNKKPSEDRVLLEGIIILSGKKDEIQNITKAWKKKVLSDAIKIPIFNLILRKCSPKAIYLEDEVNLPSHLPMPQLQPRPQQPDSEEKK